MNEELQTLHTTVIQGKIYQRETQAEVRAQRKGWGWGWEASSIQKVLPGNDAAI